MNNMFNMMSMLKQFKENPIKMLSQRFSLPEGIASDPQQIVKHLVDSGQVSQAQIDQAMQMREMFK